MPDAEKVTFRLNYEAAGKEKLCLRRGNADWLKENA